MKQHVSSLLLLVTFLICSSYAYGRIRHLRKRRPSVGESTTSSITKFVIRSEAFLLDLGDDAIPTDEDLIYSLRYTFEALHDTTGGMQDAMVVDQFEVGLHHYSVLCMTILGSNSLTTSNLNDRELRRRRKDNNSPQEIDDVAELIPPVKSVKTNTITKSVLSLMNDNLPPGTFRIHLMLEVPSSICAAADMIPAPVQQVDVYPPSTSPSALFSVSSIAPSEAPSSNRRQPTLIPSLFSHSEAPSILFGKPSLPPSLEPSYLFSGSPSEELPILLSLGPSSIPTMLPPWTAPTLIINAPSAAYSLVPSGQQVSHQPSLLLSGYPTILLSMSPSIVPFASHSVFPSGIKPILSGAPSEYPSSFVTSTTPSIHESHQPSRTPSTNPSSVVTSVPSALSSFPSVEPSVSRPSISLPPSLLPFPSAISSIPSINPSGLPSLDSSWLPSISASPSSSLTQMPTLPEEASNQPSLQPSSQEPSLQPSSQEPSLQPSSQEPSLQPSSHEPSLQPSLSVFPSLSPPDWYQFGSTLLGGNMRRVSLSNNGHTLAAVFTECKGDIACARIYQYKTLVIDEFTNVTDWHQLGSDLFASDDVASVDSVAVSGDASAFAIGTTHAIDGVHRQFFLEVFSVSTLQPLGEVLVESLPHSDIYETKTSLSFDASVLSFGISTHAVDGKFLYQNYQRDASVENWQRSGSALVLNVSATAEISGDGYTVALLDTNPSLLYHLNSDGNWDERTNGLPKDYYYRMSLNENGMVLATRQLMEEGLVDVFSFDGGQWKQTGAVQTGQVYESNFGYELDLSADGKTVAIATFRSDTSTISCTQAFQLDDETEEWLPMGRPPCGNLQRGHTAFGTYLSLSGNGMLMSVGDYGRIGGGPFDTNGHIHSYAYQPAEKEG